MARDQRRESGVSRAGNTPYSRFELRANFPANGKDESAHGLCPLASWLNIMHMTFPDRRATVLAATAMSGIGLPASAHAGVVPRIAAFESRFAIIADSTVGLVEYRDNAKSAHRP